MPSVKMFGNMIELKNPHSTRVQMATCPVVNIEIVIKHGSRKAENAEQLPDFILVKIHDQAGGQPARRPSRAIPGRTPSSRCAHALQS